MNARHEQVRRGRATPSSLEEHDLVATDLILTALVFAAYAAFVLWLFGAL